MGRWSWSNAWRWATLRPRARCKSVDLTEFVGRLRSCLNWWYAKIPFLLQDQELLAFFSYQRVLRFKGANSKSCLFSDVVKVDPSERLPLSGGYALSIILTQQACCRYTW